MKPFVFNQPLTNTKVPIVAAFLTAVLLSQGILAQPFTEVPLNNELYARALSGVNVGKAQVNFKGTISSAMFPNVKVYRRMDGVNPFMAVITASNLSNNIDAFDLLGPDGLNSYLHSYDYEIRGVPPTGPEVTLYSVTNIVAGDVYIVDGQSNALSAQFVGDANSVANSPNRQWVRAYGSATTTFGGYMHQWFIGDGNPTGMTPESINGVVGQWPMRMASNLVGATKIPVAIFNGAKFGNEIGYFQKAAPFTEGSGNMNNYLRLLARIQETRITIFRGIFWYQGEDEPTVIPPRTTNGYTNQFTTLYNNWTTDYNPQRVYIFQIRFGCYYNPPNNKTAQDFIPVMEAQRRFPSIFSNVSLISTSGADQFNQGGSLEFCHYPLDNGYKRIGDWASDIVARDLYGISGSAIIDPPTPTTATFTSAIGVGVANQVTVFMQNPVASDLAVSPVDANLTSEFALKKTGSATTFNIATVSVPNTGPARVVINFTSSPLGQNPDSISYLPHFGTSNPVIKTVSSGIHGGLGLLNFKMKIELGILPLDPLELTASKKDKGNALHWNVETNEDFRIFIVERSDDGQNFAEIASVNPSPATLKASYDYVDQSPTAKSLYRVRGLKKTGNYIYSQVVAITNNTSRGSGLLVYPNPVTDRATISLTLDEPTTADLQLFSVAGKLVSNRKISLQRGSNYVGVSEATVLNPGIYLLRVVTPDQTYTARLVKSK